MEAARKAKTYISIIICQKVETGRWNGLKREERICRQCTMGEIEDEEVSLLRCEDLKQEREAILDCKYDQCSWRVSF